MNNFNRTEALEKLRMSGIKLHATICVGRCENTQWVPVVLKDVVEGYAPFIVHSPDDTKWDIEMIAPFEGNEMAVYTEDDVFDLWDETRL